MTRNEHTSKKEGSIAGKVLRGSITKATITSKQLKGLAATALTQVADKPKRK